MSTPRWPIVLWLVTMGTVVVATLINLATSSVDVSASWGFRGSQSVFAVAAGTVGAVVGLRRPDNRVGWLFVAVGLLFAVESLVNEYTIATVLAIPGVQPAEPAIGWVLTWIWVLPVALALIFLPLVFPTGHLPSRRWRPVAWLGVLATVLLATVTAVAPGQIEQATFLDNPFRPGLIDEPQVGTLFAVAMLPFALSFVLAVASLVRRFRAADDVARRQIKWFALAVAIAGSALAGYVASFVLESSPSVSKVFEILVIVSLLGLPVAAGLAILRYRLYDIDRIISRTIAYGIVSAALVATYALVILLLQGPMGDVLGGDTISVALSTLVVAALFQPLRSRVKMVVDRRFDRARYDGQRLADAFASRLRDEVDITAVTADLDATVRAAVRPVSASLWVRGRG